MKAVSDLGMCADVHAGLFDDVKYLAEVRKKFSNGSGEEGATPEPPKNEPENTPQEKSRQSDESGNPVSAQMGKKIYKFFKDAGFEYQDIISYLKENYQVDRTEKVPEGKAQALLNGLQDGSITPIGQPAGAVAGDDDIPF